MFNLINTVHRLPDYWHFNPGLLMPVGPFTLDLVGEGLNHHSAAHVGPQSSRQPVPVELIREGPAHTAHQPEAVIGCLTSLILAYTSINPFNSHPCPLPSPLIAVPPHSVSEMAWSEDAMSITSASCCSICLSSRRSCAIVACCCDIMRSSWPTTCTDRIASLSGQFT